MRFYPTHDIATDKRTIVSVVFERETGEADAPTLEATFEYVPPDIFNLTDAYPGVLIPLTVTRRDTREVVALNAEERTQVFQAAAEYAGGITF